MTRRLIISLLTIIASLIAVAVVYAQDGKPVSDDDVNRVRREILARVRKQKRTLLNTLRVRRDVVRDIHDGCAGVDAEDDTFHRPNKSIAHAKIGRQCDNAVHSKLQNEPQRRKEREEKHL